jgi:hypothetical protein
MPVYLSVIEQVGRFTIGGGTLHHDHAVLDLEQISIVAHNDVGRLSGVALFLSNKKPFRIEQVRSKN